MNWYCRTIICVDDEEPVLDSYKQILSQSEEDDEIADILSMAGERNGDLAKEDNLSKVEYNLLFAESGAKAVEMVNAELAAGRKVAAGFFDMRMPGMDGYETIKAIRELDPNILCTVVTAYTDRTVAQIRELFPHDKQDELLYFKKPFSPEELEQSALNMVSAWNRKRKLEENLRSIEKHKQGLSQILHAVTVLSGIPPHSMQYLVSGFLFQLLAFMEGEHGYSVFWNEKGEHLIYGVGRFEDDSALLKNIESNSDYQRALQKNKCFMQDNQCFIPLVAESQKLGAIYIESNHEVEGVADRSLLEVFKNQMIQLILNSLFHHKAIASEQEAMTDPLTGLYNRRFLMNKLSSMVIELGSTKDIAVLVVDLDDFKNINDKYGHPAGDAVLKKMGNLLRMAVRDYDLVGRHIDKIGETGQYAVRLGGEEFCLLLLNTGRKGAAIVGERLRHSIEQHSFQIDQEGTVLQVTASVGIFIGALTPEIENIVDVLEGFISEADKAMYAAKKQGKNRVVIYPEE